MNQDMMTFLDDLRRDLAGVARQAAREVASEAASPWRDRKGAAEYLRLAPKTIDKLKRMGRLVPRYVGNKPLYSVAELDKLASRNPGAA